MRPWSSKWPGRAWQCSVSCLQGNRVQCLSQTLSGEWQRVAPSALRYDWRLALPNTELTIFGAGELSLCPLAPCGPATWAADS